MGEIPLAVVITSVFYAKEVQPKLYMYMYMYVMMVCCGFLCVRCTCTCTTCDLCTYMYMYIHVHCFCIWVPAKWVPGCSALFVFHLEYTLMWP